MIHELRTWLFGVVLAAFAAGLANELTPKGRGKAMVRMLSGAIMVLALLRPLCSMDWKTSEIVIESFARQTEEQTELYRAEQENEIAVIIAERVETYIWDKATGLGLDCTVHVTVSCGEGVIPLPEMVELSTAYNSTLAAWIEEVVGIPAEKQIWLEEKA